MLVSLSECMVIPFQKDYNPKTLQPWRVGCEFKSVDSLPVVDSGERVPRPTVQWHEAVALHPLAFRVVAAGGFDGCVAFIGPGGTEHALRGDGWLHHQEDFQRVGKKVPRQPGIDNYRIRVIRAAGNVSVDIA